MAEIGSHKIEFYKSFFDYLKHLTTLSTGSIILLAAFLEKLFSQPKWKILVAVSLIGFVLSVIAAVIAHTLMILSFEADEQSDQEGNVVMFSLFAIWLGFLIGIVSLAIFALKNFFS